MSRQKSTPENQTKLTSNQQAQIIQRIQQIVHTQNNNPAHQAFLERLKMALTLIAPAGVEPSAIEVDAGVYLNEADVDHLSKTLPLLAQDNIVTRISLQFSKENNPMDYLDLSSLPASVSNLSVKFQKGTEPRDIIKFWSKIKELLVRNDSLTKIDVFDKNPVPAEILNSLTQNRVMYYPAPTAIEQQARAALFGEVSLTRQQRSDRGADSMHVLAHRHDGAIRDIRQDLIGINRRLDTVEDRLEVVEANQQGMGKLFVEMREANRASQEQLTQLQNMVSAIAANDDAPAYREPNTAEERYIRDFKFLANSVLANGMARNMSDHKVASGNAGSGMNPFQFIGGVLYEASRAFPLTAIVGAVAEQSALAVTEKVEQKFWSNILDLTYDGSNQYRDNLVANLAKFYAPHMEDVIPKEGMKDFIGNFFNGVIGKDISAGRIRIKLDPHALHHAQTLFRAISKKINFEVIANPRSMAARLYQIQYPGAAVETAVANDNGRATGLSGGLRGQGSGVKGSPTNSDGSGSDGSGSDGFGNTTGENSSRSDSDERKAVAVSKVLSAEELKFAEFCREELVQAERRKKDRDEEHKYDKNYESNSTPCDSLRFYLNREIYPVTGERIVITEREQALLTFLDRMDNDVKVKIEDRFKIRITEQRHDVTVANHKLNIAVKRGGANSDLRKLALQAYIEQNNLNNLLEEQREIVLKQEQALADALQSRIDFLERLNITNNDRIAPLIQDGATACSQYIDAYLSSQGPISEKPTQAERVAIRKIPGRLNFLEQIDNDEGRLPKKVKDKVVELQGWVETHRNSLEWEKSMGRNTDIELSNLDDSRKKFDNYLDKQQAACVIM